MSARASTRPPTRPSVRLAGIAAAAGLVAASGLPGLSGPAAAQAAADGKTNVILLIADGMGYNHVDVASLWEHGVAAYQDADDNIHLTGHGSDSEASQVYQDFEVQLGQDTGYIWSAPHSEVDPWASPRHITRENPDHETLVTDSAAAATAMSTGVRTRGGYLGIDRNGEPLEDMVDVATEAGMATGVVSSARFWTDTSAGFAVHTDDGDTEGIISQLLEHEDLNVVMGSGHPEYHNDGTPNAAPSYSYVSEEVLAALRGEAEAEGVADWTLVEDRSEFQALASGETPEKVFGLAPSSGTLFFDRPGERDEPFAAPMADNVPRLSEMTAAALNVLDNASEEGFFLMSEAATVDHAGHRGELGRTIEEMVEFNRMIESVVDWVEAESSWDETTVIVTSDHETGNLWGTGTFDSGEFEPITGVRGELPEAEFTDFTDAARNPEIPHYHTHQLVPLYAHGAAAQALADAARGEDEVRGAYVNNTDIAEVVHAHIRAAAQEPGEPEPTVPVPGEGRTNVILLVADGMGYNHVDVASLWEHGVAAYQDADGNVHLTGHGSDSEASQTYQEFEVQVSVETGEIRSRDYAEIDAWDSPANVTRDHPEGRMTVTDSSAAATAMSTGVKTRSRHLGIDADEQPLVGMVDVATEAGLATGLVSSAQFWTDTNAGFAVQTTDRDTQGVVDQLLYHEDLDVLMGTGHPEYSNDGTPKDGGFWSRYIDEADWDALRAGDPASAGLPDWTLVDERAGFQALAAGEFEALAAGTPERVLGVAQTDGTLFHDRPGDREEPFAAPMADNVPRLSEMTAAAISVLNNASEDGFFLMSEAATVDHAGHAGELGRTIEEMVAFHDTIETVVDWVEAESSWDETTVIVTSDHETGNLWGAGALESGDFEPITGEQGTLPDAEFIDYTDGEPGDSTPHYHTLQLVPLYAQGPAAAALEAAATGTDPVRGAYLDNTDIGRVLQEHIRAAAEQPDPEPSEPAPTPTEPGEPTEPGPTEPGPSEPAPTEPGPTEPGEEPTGGATPEPTETQGPGSPGDDAGDGGPGAPGEDEQAGPGGDGKPLPRTGTELAGLAAIAAALLAAGVAALMTARRRSSATG
ncbi:alkaline phosphatase [Sediminivirga luteola]|uniref:Alkaline phosphatase n=1 Tax=Sediminivirga luteola TaxID=1774748 RepID=A0A8J2TZM1_9MICO|nr:alkaline phosphatase [Sediminivirga luteola]GGA20721.1 hypothetical protein GCM10011333_24770 [Sediminivirga luteola]